MKSVERFECPKNKVRPRLRQGKHLNRNLKKARKLSRDKVLMEVVNKYHSKRKIETIMMELKT